MPAAVAIAATAGGNASVNLTIGHNGNEIAELVFRRFQAAGFAPRLASETQSPSVAPNEQHLSDQLDRLRDSARSQSPDLNIPLFRTFLESLPPDASGVMRFRAKANIGLQYVTRGDTEDGLRWLLEACDEAPDDPRSIANRVLAIWLKGDAEEAYRQGRERLAANPANEALAGYIPQIAVTVPAVTDGLDGIPDALRDREGIVVGQAMFLRGRNISPDWREWARAGAVRFPDSERLKVLAAISQVDEIAHDREFQRTQILSVGQKARLQDAVAILDADWQAKTWLLKNPFDDAAYTLTAAMIAHHFLHDRETALARAARIADEGLAIPDILVDAVMIAHSYGDLDLAKRLIALVPDDTDLAFQAAVIAVQEDDWAKATALYAKADIPETERRLAETVVALAPIKAAGKPADGSPVDPEPLGRLLEATQDSPRGMVLIASVASELGLAKLARQAFKAAVDAVSDDSHIATRLMVAAYAERIGSPSGIIRLLDGHLPFEGFEREHERLAAAHANERPHRPRNLSYFQNLPLAVRQRREIARAYASVLLDGGRLPEAASLLRGLHDEDASDSFVTLRLVEVLHRSGDKSGASAVLRRLDLAGAKGSPEHVMRLAHLIMHEGAPGRAYPVAYDLVRRHRDNAEIALGYLGLGLLLEDRNPVFEMNAVETDAYVAVVAPDGAVTAFVIDEGEEFFGIAVRTPANGMAAKVMGKQRGDTFEMPKLGFDPETWTVREVTSKYMHLHRRILDEFETRFPDKLGIARFTVEDGNVDAVLDVVRRRAEQNQKTAKAYLEQPLPLGFVARLLGGDVISFAGFVRSLGGDIVTCRGSQRERTEAVSLARDRRGLGAVLDPYTAWVAAELKLLPTMKDWFGTLFTPSSTMAMIDRMIEREREGMGRTQISIAWHDGHFYRQEITDDLRHQEIENLTRLRTAIAADCEVRTVLVPNKITDTAEHILRKAGGRFLDAAFLAAETGAVLLSDDMRYRQWAAEVVGCRGLWLQAALWAALGEGWQTPSDYGKAIVGLSALRHGHVALTGPVLYVIARGDEEGFPGLRTALTRLAGPSAEMASHLSVFRDLLGLLWPPDEHLPLLPTQAVTGLALEALLAHRKDDAIRVLRAALQCAPRNRAASRYLASWLRGHFITDEVLNPKPVPLERNQPANDDAASSRSRKGKGRSRGRRR